MTRARRTRVRRHRAAASRFVYSEATTTATRLAAFISARARGFGLRRMALWRGLKTALVFARRISALLLYFLSRTRANAHARLAA